MRKNNKFNKIKLNLKIKKLTDGVGHVTQSSTLIG